MEKHHRTWQRLMWIVIALVCFFFAARIYLVKTDGFRLGNIHYSIPHHVEWEVPPLLPEEKAQLDTVLSQEFSYLAKGAQCFAFLSRDKKYVLKLFKFKHLKPSWLVQMLPPVYPFRQYREKKIAQKQQRLENVFGGYKLAYDLFKEESGLLYIHLNLTRDKHQAVTLRDKIQRKWTIDLDDVVFVVQEKAIKMRDEMNYLFSRGDIAVAKRRIDQVIDLYLKQYQRGIYDWGHGVMHNNGFVGEKPIHFDVEKLRRDDNIRRPEVYRDNLDKIAKKTELWVKRNYPQHVGEIHQYLKKKLSSAGKICYN